jgi:hypothetical protein
MSRVLAVVAACLLCVRVAHADAVDANVRQLSNTSAAHKVRLASALALAKSRDPRAVIGLAEALANDGDSTIRRVAALGLEQNVDARTPEDARALAFDALEKAELSDGDEKVRGTAAAAMRSLAKLRKKGSSGSKPSAAQKPSVFVNIDSTIDQSKMLPNGAGDRIAKIVRAGVDTTGYSTSWPGGLPTQKDLAQSNAQGYIVASTVKKIDITKSGPQTQIACTLAIRVSPWDGTDGGEKWEANRAASASGSAKATTGNDSRSIQGGVRDCLEAVTENVTSRQVVPFLKRLSGS